MLAGDFSEKEAFVGELSQLNVWDRVLSRRAIVTQHNMCYIGDGSVNKWEQFKSSVRGGVQVIPQQYAWFRGEGLSLEKTSGIFHVT